MWDGMLAGKSPTAAPALNLAQRERALRHREEALARKITAQRFVECETFTADLVRRGILPAALASIATMLLVRQPDSEKVQFAETGPKETDHEALRRFLETMPRLITVGEIDGQAVRVSVTPTVEGITSGANAMVKAFADAGRTIRFDQAVEKIAAGLRMQGH
jgi:hypothetical protein